MRSHLCSLTLIIICCHCMYPAIALEGPYLGQPSPGLEAQIFAPGVFSSETGIPAPTLRPMWSPDGLEFYFRSYYPSGPSSYNYMRGLDGSWTEAEAINSATGISPGFKILSWYMAPAMSGDGRRIYFMVDGSSESEIWVSERTETNWSDPRNLQIPLPDFELWCISVTNDGTIYMTLGREASQTYSIYRARPDEHGTYPAIENITSHIGIRNTFWHQIAPDESFLLATQYGVSGGQGKYDIYVCFRDEQDQWIAPRNLGPKVNTNQDETEFFLTADRKYLFFCHSTAIYQNPSNVYWIEGRAVLPDPNGPIHNLTTGQWFGSIQLAVDYARDGDQIQMEPGVYEENITIDKDITLQSVDPNDPYYIGGTIILGDVSNPVLTLEDNSAACEIAGLTLRTGSIGISGTTTQATIRNCRIMDNTEHGMELSLGSRPHLLHCLITANGQTGIKMLPGSGRGSPPCKPVIEDCVIAQNGSASIVGGEPVMVNSVLD